MGFQSEGQQAISRESDLSRVKHSTVSSDDRHKKTVIIGATNNPHRYAYLAAKRLTSHHHPIVPLGIRKGKVMGQDILDIRKKPEIKDVDTVTMYINPTRQPEWEEYILDLRPNRIIFNPGTENPDFATKAQNMGIETNNACTLVMLSIGNY